VNLSAIGDKHLDVTIFSQDRGISIVINNRHRFRLELSDKWGWELYAGEKPYPPFITSFRKTYRTDEVRVLARTLDFIHRNRKRLLCEGQG
jgi:hypothetical protein